MWFFVIISLILSLLCIGLSSGLCTAFLYCTTTDYTLGGVVCGILGGIFGILASVIAIFFLARSSKRKIVKYAAMITYVPAAMLSVSAAVIFGYYAGVGQLALAIVSCISEVSLVVMILLTVPALGYIREES